jgi:hypothetical protein
MTALYSHRSTHSDIITILPRKAIVHIWRHSSKLNMGFANYSHKSHPLGNMLLQAQSLPQGHRVNHTITLLTMKSRARAPYSLPYP